MVEILSIRFHLCHNRTGKSVKVPIFLLALDAARHVKINGSPVSLTENSAVFCKTDFLKKITDFKKSAHSLTVFWLKAISCDNLAEVAEKVNIAFSRDLTIPASVLHICDNDQY